MDDPDAKTLLCRHPWLDGFCSQLAEMVHGRAAAVESITGCQRTAAVVALPLWCWVVPPSETDAAPRSSAILWPVRVSWDTSPVLVVPDGEAVSANWQAIGYGRTSTGRTLVSAQAGGPLAPWPTQGGPSADAAAPSLAPRRVRGALNDLVQRGDAARWAATATLEPKAMAAMEAAHASIAAEIGPALDGSRRLIDAIEVETLVDRLVLGDPDSSRPAPVQRLIERCLNPSAFLRVDPKHYVGAALRVDATDAIRRHVGDPHVGPKVRAAAVALGSTDVPAVLAFYRARRPGDRLGVNRAAAALDLARRLTGPATSWPVVPSGRSDYRRSA